MEISMKEVREEIDLIDKELVLLSLKYKLIQKCNDLVGEIEMEVMHGGERDGGEV